MTESKILKCVECGSKYVVNKKYCLCEACNFKRTHKGKSKQQVYAERSLLRISQRQVDQNKEEGERGRWDKPKKRINSISSKNKYHCSDGSLVTQSDITAHYRIIQEHISNTRDAVCQGTGRRDLPLSFSHTISRARCKEIGKTELIWDENNIEVESMGTNDSAHYIWEHGDLEMKKTLLNFKKKLEYIKLHDQQIYQKLI